MLATPSSRELREEIRNRISLILFNSDLKDVLLVTPKSKIILSVNNKWHKLDKIDIIQINEALKEKEIAETDIFFSKIEKEIYYDIVAPLVTGNGIAEAVLIFRIAPSQYLFPILNRWPVYSNTSETEILKVQGDSILFLNPLRFIDNSQLNVKLPSDNKEMPEVKAIMGERGLVEGKDYRGKDVLAFITTIPNMDWKIIAKVDRSELYSEIYTLSANVMTITLGLIVFCSFGIGFFFNNRQKIIYKELYDKEKILMQHREEFKVVLDSTGDGVITTDTKGKIKYMNRTAEGLTGWKLTDATGRLLDDVYRIKNEFTDTIEENAVQKVLKTGIVKGLANHTILISKSGKEFAVMDTGAPILNEGNIIGIVLTFRDETEKRQQQKLLRDSERLFSTIFNTSPMGIALLKFESGAFYQVNTAFLNMLQFNKDEVIGHTIDELDLLSNPENKIIYKETIRERRSLSDLEIVFKKKNNSEGIALFLAELIELKNELFVLASFHDITQRKMDEEKLREGEIKYRNTLDNMIEGCQIISYDWKYLYINNAAAKHGRREKEEYIGRSMLELYPGIDKTDMFKKLECCMIEREPVEIDNEFTYPDGSFGYFELNAQPVPEGIFILSVDITGQRLSEKELVHRTERFNKLVAQLNDVIWTGSKDGSEILEINDAFEEIYGIPVQNIKSNPSFWLDVVHPDDKEIALKSNKELFNLGYSTSEYRIITPDGSIRWILDRKSIIYNDSGEPREIGGIASDITERKKFESEQKFTIALLTILNAPSDLRSLAKGVIELFKKEFAVEAAAIRLEKDFDYPYLLYEGFPELFIRNDNKLCQRNIKEQIVLDENGKPVLQCMCGTVIMGDVDFSKPYFTKNGSFWTNNISEMLKTEIFGGIKLKSIYNCHTEGYESVALIPIKTEHKIYGLLQLNDRRKGMFELEKIEMIERMTSIVANTIAFLLSQESLLKSEEKYRRLFENLVEGYSYCKMIYENDRPVDWVFIDVNDSFERITGFKDVIAKPISQVAPGIIGEMPELLERYSRVALTGRPEKFEIFIKAIKAWFSVSVFSPERDYFVAVLDEITERKNAEKEIIAAKEKAEELNMIKTNFFANMSHELRTPFVGIIGYAQLLKEIISSGEAVEYVEGILNTSSRMVDTLTKILDLTRLEFEKTDIVLDKIDAASTMNTIAKQYLAAADVKKLKYVVDIKFESLYMISDARILDVIFGNLISNAIKFTEAGSVELTASVVADTDVSYLVVEVADTGIGIPADKQEIIWDEFRQVSEGTTRSYQGSGLGLAITRKYVNLLGGKISVISRVGEGSRFLVELPFEKLSDINLTGNEIDNDDIISLPQSFNAPLLKRILYVEDDMDSRTVITRFLEDEYIIDTAENANEAFNMVNKNNYDLILMDINLGLEPNGIEVAKIIRKKAGFEKIPIIAITAFAGERNREEFLAGGMDYFIAKPFLKNELMKVIGSALKTNDTL